LRASDIIPHRAWTENSKEFLAETLKHAVSDGYPLLGEFEFRHYPSLRQLKRGKLFRDVVVPINGPLGQELFAFAETTGLPFEIHYEIEDALLPPLEEMLGRYPRAKVMRLATIGDASCCGCKIAWHHPAGRYPGGRPSRGPGLLDSIRLGALYFSIYTVFLFNS
jgi:hypothetical protein